MGTPQGMKCFNHKLQDGANVFIYSNPKHIVLQIRHQTPTEENVLDPSFKVAVALSSVEAEDIANVLLSAAGHADR
jgi:hypothetical protein